VKHLKPTKAETWQAHPAAAPGSRQLDPDTFRSAGNGTRICSGGWQFAFAGLEPGEHVSIRIDAEHEGIDSVREATLCTAVWGDVSADSPRIPGTPARDLLIPHETGPSSVQFSRTVVVPEGIDHLTIRCTLRWVAAGHVDWHTPQVEWVAGAERPGRDVAIAVVTGCHGQRPRMTSPQDNIEYYSALCERVCRESKVDLIALPEVALNWGVGDALDVALPAPGPETDVFADIAERHGTRIVIGLYERDRDACHNSLILLGPDRRIEARYRKVHLASGGESESGLLPGDSFPVADTAIGRIGFNICMDSSAAESARMVGLNGADFLVLAIMGDHRADRLSPGSPIFNPARWLAIQRTRALDNQLCMVIARNTAIGSCIIDRRGDVLAWNEGDKEWITATVNPQDVCRYWTGEELRDVNWVQRRPHLYAEYAKPSNYGSLR